MINNKPMSVLPWLDPYDDEQPFPDPKLALHEPDGLLAVGGSLTPARLLRAYRQGIFPWYSDDQPILWWSPDPRTILLPESIKISRSLRKTLRKQNHFRVTMDKAFEQVIQHCSEPRRDGIGTWLTAEMKAAYGHLHKLGFAHSVETWHDDQLVGGLYGVALGGVFFGESMFTRMTDASKVALVYLCAQLQAWRFAMIDCQMCTEHLLRMGAENIPRQLFTDCLQQLCDLPNRQGVWHCQPDVIDNLGYAV